MLVYAEIGAWDIGRVFLHTLPEITAWVVSLALLGLALGIVSLMVALRWMLPWSRLHLLRQGGRGWVWVTVQWTWVLLWGICLPLLGLGIGALAGSAFGARSLVQREHVGQVVGERVLSPLCVQVALQLEKQYPAYGRVSSDEFAIPQVQELLEKVTPQLLDDALSHVKMLDENDASVGAVELCGRRYTRKAIHYAAQSYFQRKARIIQVLVDELQARTHSDRARLRDVVACASHLYFTPAFANWTFWWVLAHSAALVAVLATVWVLPGTLFAAYWWWRNRQSGGPDEVAHGIPAVPGP
jgi:hypothetical protein